MVRHSKEDVLNSHERETLLNNCELEKETLIIKGLLFTGLRADEFSHLNISWISWQDELIKIPSEQGDWKPKTSAGSRHVPLMQNAKEVLFNHFEKKDKIGFNRSTIFRIVRRVAKRTNLKKKVYPHSLRATFASMMADKGMSPSDIQQIMGWSKLETANSYVRATQSIQNFKQKMEV